MNAEQSIDTQIDPAIQAPTAATPDVLGAIGSFQKAYDGAMRQEMGYHAAWPPLVNQVAVGVFGKFVNGIFQVVGNLTDHTGGQLVIQPVSVGEELKDLNWETGSIKVQSYVIKGGVKTPGTIPDSADVQAELDYSFGSANSIKSVCTNLSLEAISANPYDYFHDTVWPALKSQGRTWDTSLRIVYRVYSASNYVLMGSSQKNSSFNLTAIANVLFDYTEGKLSGQIGITSQQKQDLMLTGFAQPGVIGMDLMSFKSDGTPILPNN